MRRMWDLTNPLLCAFSGKRANAKKKGIPFSIRFEEIDWPEVCPVLGIAINYQRHRGVGHCQDDSPSFDRLDPSGGYVSGNVRIISHRANQLKSNATAAELRRVAQWIEDMEAPA